MWRRFLAAILVCVLLCVTCAVALAECNITIGGVHYGLLSDEMLVYAEDTTVTNAAIEPYINIEGNALPVTTIKENGFSNCTVLKSVTMPNTVTTVGQYAFGGCTALTEVKLSSSLSTITNNMFDGCSSLPRVTIPSGVISIGDSAFIFCTKLANVTIPDSVISIADNAFWGCSSLASVTIPENVIKIGKDAFGQCTALKSVCIPKSVSSIGVGAFAEGTVICCYENTCAEEWAKKNNHPVKLLVDSVTLDRTTLTLTRTAKQLKPAVQLKAAVKPDQAANKAVTWTSSDKTVAVVDSTGLVTALKPGTVTVTCTAKDGSGTKASCTVTVKDQKVTSFQVVQKDKTKNLKGTTVSLRKGQKLTLKIQKLKPSGAVNQKVTWKSSKPKIAKISSKGVITALKKGTTVITVQSKDKGYKLTFTVKVK